jgi:hypothetical protein
MKIATHHVVNGLNTSRSVSDQYEAFSVHPVSIVSDVMRSDDLVIVAGRG